MVSEVFCDAIINDKRCRKPAHEQVTACTGYKISTEGPLGKETYEPFDRPIVRQLDLCPECYKRWCEATYSAVIRTSNQTPIRQIIEEVEKEHLP